MRVYTYRMFSASPLPPRLCDSHNSRVAWVSLPCPAVRGPALPTSRSEKQKTWYRAPRVGLVSLTRPVCGPREA